MQLRVGDDADRVRARGQRNQPRPSSPRRPGGWSRASAPRLAARAPGRRRRTSRRSSMRSPMRNQTALASCAFGSRQTELALEQAGAAAGVDEPARLGSRASRVAGAPGRSRCGAARRRRPASMSATIGAVDEAHAAARGLLAEEVLEDAAVDLVARHREVAAGADLGHLRRCRAGLPLKKKRKPNLLAAARSSQVLLQAEHRVEVVRADLDRRFAHLVRRFAAPDGAALEHQRRRGRRSAARSCSASVRPARPPPMMTTSCRGGSVMASVGRSVQQAAAKLQRQRGRQRQRQRSAPRASASNNGSASAIALPASARAAVERSGDRPARTGRERDQSNDGHACARSRPSGAMTSATASRPAAASSPTPARPPPACRSATSSTGRSSAAHCAAASSRPAAKLRVVRRSASCSPPCSRCRWSSSRRRRCAPSCGTWSATSTVGSVASVRTCSR